MRLPTALILAFAIATPAAAQPQEGARLRERVEQRHAQSRAVEPQPGTERIMLAKDGGTRAFLLHAPPGGSGPRPLVLVFHGLGGSGAVVERMSRFSVLAAAQGFLVAYPEGREGAWRVFAPDRADVTYARDVVAAVAERHAVDRRRVYAAGISNGAMMAALLGCEAPETFRAVGLVAGGYPRPCPTAPRAAAMLFHGTADEMLPIGGRRRMMPVRDFAAAWGSGPGCRATPHALAPMGGAPAERFACGGAEAVMVTIPGGGHVWPGGARGGRGPDASAELWRFFAALR